MISGDLSSVRTAQQDQSRVGPRLSMKSAGAVRGRVDGGWWPRSGDPEAEFPELVAALRPWLGWANRVSYHLDAWAAVPRKMFIEGRRVRFEGFRSMDAHTVVVISSVAGRISLLVVPPGAPDDMARAALASAAGGDSTWSVEDILSRSGVPPELPRPDSAVVPRAHSAESVSEERWETEGGQVRVPDRPL